MLRWTNQFCKGVGFLLKADDDMFIRVDNLLSYINKQGSSLQRTIFGDLQSEAQSIRNESSKWFITEKEYNKTYFPTYISGTAYVISGVLIPELVSTSASLPGPYLPWEDVFVAGILGELVGAKRMYHRGFTYKKRKKDPCAYKNAVSGHRVPPDEILWLWNETKKNIRDNRKCPRTMLERPLFYPFLILLTFALLRRLFPMLSRMRRLFPYIKRV